jgi:hypothetical protein
VCDRDNRCRTLNPGETAQSATGVLFALAHLPRNMPPAPEIFVGLSFLSAQYATANLAAALNIIEGKSSRATQYPSFEDLATQTEFVWCSALDGLAVTPLDADLDIREMLHSAHYRTLMSPTVKRH